MMFATVPATQLGWVRDVSQIKFLITIHVNVIAIIVCLPNNVLLLLLLTIRIALAILVICHAAILIKSTAIRADALAILNI